MRRNDGSGCDGATSHSTNNCRPGFMPSPPPDWSSITPSATIYCHHHRLSLPTLCTLVCLPRPAHLRRQLAVPRARQPSSKLKRPCPRMPPSAPLDPLNSRSSSTHLAGSGTASHLQFRPGVRWSPYYGSLHPSNQTPPSQNKNQPRSPPWPIPSSLPRYDRVHRRMPT